MHFQRLALAEQGRVLSALAPARLILWDAGYTPDSSVDCAYVAAMAGGQVLGSGTMGWLHGWAPEAVLVLPSTGPRTQNRPTEPEDDLEV